MNITIFNMTTPALSHRQLATEVRSSLRNDPDEEDFEPAAANLIQATSSLFRRRSNGGKYSCFLRLLHFIPLVCCLLLLFIFQTIGKTIHSN